MLPLQVVRHRMSFGDVAFLSSLVATAEQNNDGCASPDKIQAIARPIVDPQLGYAMPHGLNVAGIAEGEPPDTDVNPRPRFVVSQTTKPVRKLRGLAHLDFHRLSLIKDNLSSLGGIDPLAL